jgi:hypothetical protein
MTFPIHTFAKFDAAMTAGESFLQAGHLISARHAFAKAHVLGHDDTRSHVRAHWGLVRVGFAARSVSEVLTQLGLSVIAQLFTRPLLSSGSVRTDCADRA